MPEARPTIQSVLKAALVSAHQIVEGTIADIDDDLANRPPFGVAHSLGAIIGHLTYSEDALVNAVCRGGAPLFVSTWAGRTGFNQIIPRRGSPESEVLEWYRTAQIDVAAQRLYRQAIFAASEEYIGSLDDGALTRTVESPFGPLPLAEFFASVVIGHVNNHIGEVAAIKGALGRRGYPF